MKEYRGTGKQTKGIIRGFVAKKYGNSYCSARWWFISGDKDAVYDGVLV
jgi:hypothetical protein